MKKTKRPVLYEISKFRLRCISGHKGRTIRKVMVGGGGGGGKGKGDFQLARFFFSSSACADFVCLFVIY